MPENQGPIFRSRQSFGAEADPDRAEPKYYDLSACLTAEEFEFLRKFFNFDRENPNHYWLDTFQPPETAYLEKLISVGLIARRHSDEGHLFISKFGKMKVNQGH